VTDGGVGVLCLEAAMQGACFNVQVNAKDLKDGAVAKKFVDEAKKLMKETKDRCAKMIAKVEANIVA
jgi:glutamate formiminotransferase/formiminotetrahydrofolate cyclodeaminase